MNTNSPYSASDATAANASCDPLNSGPGLLVVKVGRTRVSVASVATVASAVAVPSALNVATRWRSVTVSSEIPTIPLAVMITAANTVSRASVEVSLPPATISVTISATSITVTEIASTSEPNGSPTRWATTSAWWTAASTAPPRNTAITATTGPCGLEPHATASTGKARSGSARGQCRAASFTPRQARPLALWTSAGRDVQRLRVDVLVV